jgi:16S rRNA (adenine1518-N6/adenine1519-N6)-dimethyltransferase
VPRKRFGQHFLLDPGVIQQIMAALSPQMGEHLVEIGPGQGALTVPVLKQVKRLEAIELDRDLSPELERRTRSLGQLDMHWADALAFDFASLKTDGRPLRIFGNLPYNISTPLIFHLLKVANLIADMLFMLQKEVAERLAAPCHTAHYGRLSVMVQYHCKVEGLFSVPPQAFYPQPQVQSSVVRLLPYPHLPHRAHDEVLFSELVKHAFGQRRKTLRNSLKNWVSDAVWEKISVPSDQRAENLTPRDFVEMANAVDQEKKAT